MIRPLLLLSVLGGTPASLSAQAMPRMTMPGMEMPGMTMPAKAPPRKRAPARKPTRVPKAAPATSNPCPPEHAAMGHCTPADPPAEPAAMPAMQMPMPMPMPVPVPTAAAGTALPAGNAAAPAPPTTRAADRFYPATTMARASAALRKEHGGLAFSQILFNLAEVRGGDAYRWDGEGWYGGDIHRLVVKSEGEGRFGDRLDDADVQLLYSRAIDPYFDLQAGLRQAFGTGPDRTYATIGIEGLAPYWFDVEAAAFLSDKGDLLARLEAWYDQRLTQRLILQPRVEANLAAQDMPANRIGSGLSDVEAGLRLRYEITRRFAPYAGLSWDRRFGDTARIARAAGEDKGGLAFVAGIRTWF